MACLEWKMMCPRCGNDTHLDRAPDRLGQLDAFSGEIFGIFASFRDSRGQIQAYVLLHS